MNESTFRQKTLGERLHQKRIEQGITIKKVSEDLKIREVYINAMEQSSWDIFASDVYTKGFIRNYAQYLGISPNVALRLFQRENLSKDGGAKNKEQDDNPNSTRLGFNLMLSANRLMVGSVMIAVVLLVVFFVIRLFQVSNKPILKLQEPVLANSIENIEYRFDTEENEVTISGEIGTGDALFINDKQIETFGMDKFEILEDELTYGENLFEIKSKNQFGIESNLRLIVVNNSEEIYGPRRIEY